jgi:hypothetical protein
MNLDREAKGLLLAIAALLAAIAVRLCFNAPPVHGESGEPYPIYVEPGVSMLRAPDGSGQVLGKVVVDLRNGNIWGYPTLSRDPYPSNANGSTKFPVSRPFLLGRYEFKDMDK